jgi:lipopolysaccharide export system permease protein
VFCFWINAEINPRARLKMKEILHSLAASSLLKDSSTERTFRLPQALIYTASQEQGHLENIQVYEFNETSELQKVIYAKSGWVESMDEKDQLLVHLQDAVVDDRVPELEAGDASFRGGMSAGEVVYQISLFDLWGKYTPANYRSLGTYTLGDLREQLQPGPRYSQLLTEFNKRLSMSLACLVFALAGVPLAIMLHRRETTLGFGSGLAMGCVYYGFISIADNCRENPNLHPELLAWTSTFFFLMLGSILFWCLGKR